MNLLSRTGKSYSRFGRCLVKPAGSPPPGRRRNFLGKSLLVVAFLVFGSQSTYAQNAPSLSASLSTRKLYIGETTQLRIDISNAGNIGSPPNIEVNGLATRFLSSSTSQSFQMGSARTWSATTQTLHYLIEALEPGRFTIPPIRLSIGGKDYATEPLELIVLEPDISNNQPDLSRDVILHLSLPETELYVGEIAPVRVTLYVLNQNSIQGMAPPQIENDQLAIKRFDMQDERRSATQLDGRIFSTLAVESALFPVKPGPTVVGPATAETIFRDPASPARPQFGFFSRSPRRVLSSNRVEIEVKPLPQNGRPTSFQGAVGQFEMSVSASPTKLSVGDPISIDIEITGTGNFESLEYPAITGPEGWRFYPEREVVKTLSDGVTQGRLAISRVIVPLEEHNEIPPFELSFFDPKKRKYITLRTQSIPIELVPDSLLTDSSRSSDDGLYRDGAPPASSDVRVANNATSKPDILYQDILFIHNSPPSFAHIDASLVKSIGFWLAQFPPAFLALIMVCVLIVRHRRERKSQEPADRHQSCSQIRTRLEVANLTRYEFYRSILEYLDQLQRERVGTDGTPSAEAAVLRETADRNVYGERNSPTPEGSSIDIEERRDVLDVLNEISSS